MYWSRLRVFLVLVVLVMVVLGGRLAHLQLCRSDAYRLEAADNLCRPARLLETRRGSILDRGGRRLAEDVPRFDLCVYFPFLALRDEAFVARKAARDRLTLQAAREAMGPLWLEADRLTGFKADLGRRDERDADFLGEASDFWPDLADRLGIDIETIDRTREEILRQVAGIRDRISAARGRDILVREETYRAPGSVPHAIIRDLGEEAKAVIVGLQRDKPFLLIRERAERRCRYGDLAGHVIGYVSEVPEELLSADPDGARDDHGWTLDPAERMRGSGPDRELRRYQLGDSCGRAGLEAALEPVLRGARGLERRHRHGQVLERVPQRAGKDVVLTLDVPFQNDVEAFLDRPMNLPAGYGTPRGAAVVIDLADGGILALASTPRPDPNLIRDADYYEKLRTDTEACPLMHRAVAGQFSLGSIFKCVTATAGLHERVIAPNTTLHCMGALDLEHPGRFRCLGIHGDIALQRAIRVSCNVFFYQVGQLLGSARLTDWGRRFGFGRAVGILLPGEAAGYLPDNIDPRNLAIGQGELMVTPLQVARMIALVATDGRMNEVHLVKEVRLATEDGVTKLPRPIRRVDMGLDPRLVAEVRRALTGAVNETDGTGYKTVRSPDIVIAGKTGSAQSGAGREPHSWFVGFAPANRPQIAVAVVVEHAGHGGTVAGPVARQIIEAALRHGIITAH